MITSRLVVAGLLSLGLIAAVDAAVPVTQPSQPRPNPTSIKPLIVPATMPATRPTTTASASTRPMSKFPSPRELLAKMKADRQREDALPKVAFFNLSKPIVEKPADFTFFGENDSTTLRSLIERLRQARNDKNLKAVLITLGEPGLSLAQAQEIRDELSEIVKAGRKVFVYADSYDTIGYILASGASDICLLEGGEILIPGIGVETTFAKGLLDKVGVRADYIQIGEYKGADEQLTRTTPSNELRGELNKLIDAMYAQIVDSIATRRALPPDAVKSIIDEAMMTGKVAKQRKLVDHLIDEDGLRELIAGALKEKEINLLRDYGKPERAEVDLSNPWALFSMLARKPETNEKDDQIALIYATGMIVDGEGGEGLFGGGGRVGSDSMRKALRAALRDEKVKAVVIRIDSPGGSALASEAMWQAARRVAAKKPLFISVGGMAASGGYYLASAGDTIYADPSAIVGSIGVVGGKFVLQGLFDKLGITTESFRRGRNADLFSSTQPFTDKQREMVTAWMRQTYEQFTQRVMTTRKGKIKDIDAVARGRIFVARDAKALGMVDELGGLDATITAAAKKVGLQPGEYDIRVLPQPKTFADYLSGRADDEAAAPSIRPSMHIDATAVLGALTPEMRRAVADQLQVLQLLQDRPVILVSPCVITTK